MKKTYMIPTLQVVKIQPAQILAGSEIGKSEYAGGGVGARSAGFSESDDEDWED